MTGPKFVKYFTLFVRNKYIDTINSVFIQVCVKIYFNA